MAYHGMDGGHYDDEGDDEKLLGLDGTPFKNTLVEEETIASDGGTSLEAAVTRKRNKRVLGVAFVTFFLFAVAEVLGGLLGHSLALASDASTMLVDAVTYILNLYAEHKKAKATPRGVLLYELVSPTFSVVALIATTIYILVAAIQELHPDPNAADDSPNIIVMWFFTLLNLTIDIVNIVLFVREHRRKVAQLAAHGRKLTKTESNANMLSALTHVAIDTMRTLSVFIALIANKFFGLSPTDADAYASISIAILTMFSTIPLFRVLYRKLHALRELRQNTAADTEA